MVGIFLVSGVEDLAVPPAGLSDKVGHVLAYGGLALFALRALARARVAGVNWGSSALAWAIATTYGATDEVHQMFVHGRVAALDDWLADALGAAVALVIVAVAVAGLRETRGV